MSYSFWKLENPLGYRHKIISRKHEMPNNHENNRVSLRRTGTQKNIIKDIVYRHIVIKAENEKK